jgi:REP element-mobilizing transposase RayT
MRLNELGRIVQEEWFKTVALRPYVRLEEHEFVIMPNHIHGIIWISNDFVGARRHRAPTPRFGKPIAGSLANIVRAFKAAVTYRAGRELDLANIWQRNYYEHIIRNQAEYERIAHYLTLNPARWNDDKENPARKRP